MVLVNNIYHAYVNYSGVYFKTNPFFRDSAEGSVELRTRNKVRLEAAKCIRPGRGGGARFDSHTPN